MSYATDEIDQLVLNYMNEKPVALVDFERWGIRHGTARNAVGRLLKAGLVERKWEGNQRFGRYLYTKKLAKDEQERESNGLLDRQNTKISSEIPATGPWIPNSR
jgi:predicted transcriptional regulator